MGAAISSVVTPLFGISVFGVSIWQRFGTLLKQSTLINIGLAGVLMFGIDALLPETEGWAMLLHGIGLGVYAATLMLRGEVTLQDVAVLLPGKSSPGTRSQGEPAT